MAQSGTVYPIDLSVIMTPPYGPCLKEYVGSNRIAIQALLKDYSKNSTQFVVELKVADNRNRVVLLTKLGDYDFPAGKTFTYPMGPNSNFDRNALDDIFRYASVKPKNECFDEGSYTFTFQAYDAKFYPSRKIALSMPFNYPVFLQGNNVEPLPIYPYENEVICNAFYEYTNNNGLKKTATQLGSIPYQWQAANPTGMSVGYLLQVVSLGEIGERTKAQIESEANGAFNKTDNYVVNEFGYTPFYNHPLTVGNYQTGYAYAWRVFALTGNDLELRENADLRSKNVSSRVFYFCGNPGEEKDDYKVIKDERKFDSELAVVKLDSIISSGVNTNAYWRDSFIKKDYCGVSVEIRKKGQEKWAPFFVEESDEKDELGRPIDNVHNFSNLNYDTPYELRAQYVKCDGENRIYAPYSKVMTFSIPSPADTTECGNNLPELAECGEGTTVPKLKAGDTIFANGTRVIVDSISYSQQDSSVISGSGHICLPILKLIQLRMEFKDIKINCAKELVKGEIKSIWDERTCAMIDIDELVGESSTGGKDNSPSNAKVITYDPATAQSQPAGTLMFNPKDSTIMFKTKDDVVKIGKAITLSSKEYKSVNHLTDETHYVDFFNEDKTNAFDKDEHKWYRKMSEYDYFDNPNNSLVVPWLANNPGILRKVKAEEMITKSTTTGSFVDVKFVIPADNYYIELDAQKDSKGIYEVQIPGWADLDHSTPIFAIGRTSAGSSYMDVGKMMQANYAERTHKLKIVSLIGALNDGYLTAAQKALKDAYEPLGITYEVEISEFQNDTITMMLEDGLAIAADDESCWSSETREMRNIRILYSRHNTIDKESAYMFVVKHPEEEKFKNTVGDMPRGHSVGYVFNDNVTSSDQFGLLVAHELGHGVYKLQHTFDYKGGMNQGTTDNLMDYNNGNDLAHYQWRVMQDSAMFVWSLFQGDEDGQLQWRDFTWLGDFADGIFLDNEEKLVENQLEFFKYVDRAKIDGNALVDVLLRGIVETIEYGGAKFNLTREYSPNEDIVFNKLLKDSSYTLNMKKNTVFRNDSYSLIYDQEEFQKLIFFCYKDNPTLSHYKISNFKEMSDSDSRVKAGFYFKDKQSFGLISFYATDKSLDAVLMIPIQEKNDFEKAQSEFSGYVNKLLKKNTLSLFRWLPSYSSNPSSMQRIEAEEDMFESYDKEVKNYRQYLSRVASKTMTFSQGSNYLHLNYNPGRVGNDLDRLRQFKSFSIHTESDDRGMIYHTNDYKAILNGTETTATIGIFYFNNSSSEVVLEMKDVDACLYSFLGKKFGLISISNNLGIQLVIYVDIDDNLDNANAEKIVEKWVDYFVKKDDETLSISIDGAGINPHQIDYNPSCVRTAYTMNNRGITDDNFQFVYIKPSETMKVNLKVNESSINISDLKIASSKSFITVSDSRNSANKTISLTVKGNFTTLSGNNKKDVPYISISNKSGKILYKLFVVPCEKRTYDIKVKLLNGRDKKGLKTICDGFDYSKFKNALNEIYNPVNIWFNYDPIVEPINNVAFGVDSGLVYNPEKYFSVHENKYSVIFIPHEYKLSLTNSLDDTNAGYAPVNTSYPSKNNLGTATVVDSKSFDSSTPAHELGHLIFGLRHPFDKTYGIKGYEKYQDDFNLMDYGHPGIDAVIRAYDMLHINGFTNY